MARIKTGRKRGSNGLDPHQGQNDRSGSGLIAMLAQVNALPSSQGETPRRDGNLQTAADQSRLHVGRHVVRSLHRVNVVQRLGSDVIESPLHVDPNIGICIFIDAETRGSVLQETMQSPDLDFLNLGQAIQDFFSDQVAPSSHRRKLDSGLIELHKGPLAECAWMFNAS